MAMAAERQIKLQKQQPESHGRSQIRYGGTPRIMENYHLRGAMFSWPLRIHTEILRGSDHTD